MQQPRSIEDLNWLLMLSADCLRRRDFAGCRIYAIQCQEVYPEVPGAGQILTVANVLEAAEIRLRNNNLNWYNILQVSVTDSKNPRHVRYQFKKLVLQVGFYKILFPFGQEAFDLICDAFSVLRYEDKRTQYEIEIGIGIEEKPPMETNFDQSEEASMGVVLDPDVQGGGKDLGVGDDFWVVQSQEEDEIFGGLDSLVDLPSVKPGIFVKVGEN